MSDDFKERLARLELNVPRLESRQETLERENRAIVTRLGEVAVDASTAKQLGEMAQKSAAEALHTAQATHRMLTEQVQAVEQRITRHLSAQDEHLEKQDEMRESQGRLLEELHTLEKERESREKLLAEKAAEEKLEAQRREERAKSQRERREQLLRTVAFWIALPPGLLGVWAVFRPLGAWLMQQLAALIAPATH
jgi:hypothetical protein